MPIVFQERYLDHLLTPGHPESPDRLRAIIQRLGQEDMFKEHIDPKPATREQMLRTHQQTYVDMVEHFGEGYLDPDTYNRDQTFEIALLAAGGGIRAAQYAYEEQEPTLALLRPPGHHSGPDYSAGFCFFNNIAIAAHELLERVNKLAIVDIDVHHGNGTEDIFRDDERVLYISTHQWGIFPGTGYYNSVGEGDGEGYNVDIPFHHGTGDSTYLDAYRSIVIPILEQYEPELLLVSLGADAHYLDPLASLSLSSAGYLECMRLLTEFARERCENRLAVYLEGGYDLRVLPEVVASTLGLIEDKEIPLRFTQVEDRNVYGRSMLEKVREQQSQYWKL